MRGQFEQFNASNASLKYRILMLCHIIRLVSGQRIIRDKNSNWFVSHLFLFLKMKSDIDDVVAERKSKKLELFGV